MPFSSNCLWGEEGEPIETVDTQQPARKTMMAAQGGAPPAPPDDGKMVDLSDSIEKAQCFARNEDAKFPMTNLFIGDSRLGCKSDVDEQLIIHLGFREFVRIKSLQFTEFNEGRDPESNPSKIHLFVNRENLGFEDCDQIDPTQTLHLTTEDMKKPIMLKFVKFQRVTSLTIFIEDNQGGEVSALGGLKIYGRPVAGTNMADFKSKQSEM